MASIPRILAVDSKDQIANIIRGAMALLDRRSVLVEVPTAEAALFELENTNVDLLVTSFTLPDANGHELAVRAIRQSAGTIIIILADPDDPEPDQQSLENAPYTYLVRPVGEQFLRALRVGLDGAAAVLSQESSAAPGGSALDLGPIPDLDTSLIRKHLPSIMRDTAAIGMIVADRMGRVVHTEGATGYVDKDILAAVLGPAFARTVELRDLLGGNAWSLQFYDGDNYDIFALAIGLHYFLLLIFEGSKRPAYGPVTHFALKPVDALIADMGEEAAWSYRRAALRTTQTMTALPVSPTLEADIEAAEQAEAATEEPEAIPEFSLEPLNDMDVDKLFSQKVDETSFDELFSDDDALLDASFLTGGTALSVDEAIDLGILDE